MVGQGPAEHGADRGESGVAGSAAVATLLFEVVVTTTLGIPADGSRVSCALLSEGRMARCRASTTRTPRPGPSGWSVSIATTTTRVHLIHFAPRMTFGIEMRCTAEEGDASN